MHPERRVKVGLQRRRGIGGGFGVEQLPRNRGEPQGIERGKSCHLRGDLQAERRRQFGNEIAVAGQSIESRHGPAFPIRVPRR